MKLVDVKELTRQMVAQSLGHEYMEQNGYLTAIPEEKLVEVGKEISQAGMTTEKATKALGVLLAKREIDEGNFNEIFPDLWVDRIEWGGFIERDKIDFADIMDDPVMNITNGTDYSSIEHTYYQPKVRSKIYEEGKGIMIPISISREPLTEAFRNYDSMNAFVSKILAKVRMTLRLAMDRYKAALVSCAIAVSTKGTKTAVYLIDEALKEGIAGITENTTGEQALSNPAYVRFVAKKIDEVRANMKATTSAFNNGSWATASNKNFLYLISRYTRNLKFDVQSGLFHENKIAFGDYREVPMWQSPIYDSTNTDGAFSYDAVTEIDLSADPTNKLGIGTEAVQITDVLGVLFDRKALGITIFKEYTTTNYTACADFWNEFLHCLTNQLLDSDYPIVAFINGKKPEGN